MELADILYAQGFGTRRVCAGLVQQGHVQVGTERVQDPFADFEPEGLRLVVQGQPWHCHSPAYVLLHKPAGTECSRKPSAYPSVLSLLPLPLRNRPVKGGMPGVQSVGRLDQDTTGLLLLSDDGAFLHRMTSPKHQVEKLYQVRTRHPVDTVQIRRLCEGVVLDDDPKPVRAAACVATGECSLDLTLTSGKYHQVKRMLAAVGNRVEALHRARIGALSLSSDLAPGQWRWLEAADLVALESQGLSLKVGSAQSPGATAPAAPG